MGLPADPPEVTTRCCLLPEAAGQRLDQVLAALLPDTSRAQVQRWIDEGRVDVDGRQPSRKLKLKGGETVALAARYEREPGWQAQAIALDIVYEDDSILVINKPAGLVVHPGAGNPDSTLVNALLHHDPSLANLPRAGVVHRLDKDTSGLLVVARTEAARLDLIEQLSARTVRRDYLAVVNGAMVAGGTVEQPIGRSRHDRTRMGVTPGGKPAVSHYRVVERFGAHTLVRVSLETGRTHQIRVHMAHIRHPLVGDPVYGGRLRVPAGASPGLADCLRGFKRQALHAERLGLIHPVTGEHMEWHAAVPEDMQQLLEALRDNEASEQTQGARS